MHVSTINKESPLILASASPRRRKLLEQVGLPFRSLPSHIEESLPTNDPLVDVRLLAEEKARAVQAISEDHWVLGADTVVILGEAVLGKPADAQDACSMLRVLSGNEHQVVTGFCLLQPSGSLAHSEAVTTQVTIKGLSDKEITAYVSTGEPFGKAGSYAIQGIGAFMVEAISGSYTNVVGLPVCALVKALLEVRALERFPLPLWAGPAAAQSPTE